MTPANKYVPVGLECYDKLGQQQDGGGKAQTEGYVFRVWCVSSRLGRLKDSLFRTKFGPSMILTALNALQLMGKYMSCCFMILTAPES